MQFDIPYCLRHTRQVESASATFESLRVGGSLVLNLCDVPLEGLLKLDGCGLTPEDRLRVRVAMDAMRAAELEHDAEEEGMAELRKKQLARERVRRHREKSK